MGTDLLKRLASESGEATSDGKWRHALTHTDRMVVHLARAIISDPNVLVIHRPLMRFFSHEMREGVMKTLQHFVRERGVGRDPAADKLERRRPRTVFFSSAHSHEAKEADVVWRLQDGKLQIEEPGR